MDMLDSRVLSFFILMHELRASLLTLLSFCLTNSILICLLCCLSPLLSLFFAPARLSISTYLSLPPIGLNSSSTLCFYMKPEHH